MSSSGSGQGLIAHTVNRTAAMQKVAYGGHKTIDYRCKRIKWTKQKCIHCGGPAWVTVNAVHKYGKEWTCTTCRRTKRATNRREGVKAALAVALRKKEMKVRW